MRVLITGATGFVGRHLFRYCAAQGADVVGMGRHSSEPPEDSDLHTYLAADLLDSAQAEEAIRTSAPDRIFHLAAEASVGRSWDDPTGILDHNIRSTLNVLEAVRRRSPQTRVLLACSGEEYGPPERLPVTEEHRLRPQTPTP